MSDSIAPPPPVTDDFVWYRSDRVKEALQQALEDAVEIHGNPAKSFAWDVRARFQELMR